MAIEKLQNDARIETMGGDLLLIQQLQAMMTKILTDVKRIRSELEANNLHPQRVFDVVNDGLGNFIVRKKNFHEQVPTSAFGPNCSQRAHVIFSLSL